MSPRLCWTRSPINESVHQRADLEKVNRNGGSMGQRFVQPVLLVCLVVMAPLSGCFGEGDNEGFDSLGDVSVTPSMFTGGVFQGVTITADADVSAFVPYLLMNPDTGFVQNSTVVDLNAGESVLLSVLAPPRTDTAIILFGDLGRENWPVRSSEESWRTWYQRDGQDRNDNPGVQRTAGENGSLDTIVPSNSSGGPVFALRVPIERPMAPA